MSDWQSFRLAQKSHALGQMFWFFLFGVIIAMWGFGFTMYSLLARIDARAGATEIYTLSFIAGVMLLCGVMVGFYKLLELVHDVLQVGIAIGRLKTDPANDPEMVKHLVERFNDPSYRKFMRVDGLIPGVD